MTIHLLGHPALLHQMDTLSLNAHGTSGDYDRAGALHPLVLERKLKRFLLSREPFLYPELQSSVFLDFDDIVGNQAGFQLLTQHAHRQAIALEVLVLSLVL